MRSVIFVMVSVSLGLFAKAGPNCATRSVAFSLPNSASQACRGSKLTGTHTLKLCDNKKGSMKMSGREYFLYADKNLWKFREEQTNSSSGTLNIEALSIDFGNKSFNYTNEKKKEDGTVLKSTVCDGVLEMRN